MNAEIPIPRNPHRVRVRCYDNGGKTLDRYTVVYAGNQVRRLFGSFVFLGMSENPFHPQGFCQHGENDTNFIDRPRGAHLGKRVSFFSLPKDCQEAVLRDLEEKL